MPARADGSTGTRDQGGLVATLLDELAASREEAAGRDDRDAGGRGVALHRRPGVEGRLVARALDDDDPAVVAFAARLLGGLADARAVAHLARLLVHPNEQVLEGALGGLATWRPALTPIAFGAALGRAPFVLRAIAAVLGDAAEGAAARPLVTLLRDPDVTAPALRALARTGGREAVPLLVALVRDPPSVGVLESALRILAELLQRQPHPRVAHAIEHWIRVAVAEAEVPDLPLRLQRALGDPADVRPGRGVGPAVAAVVRGLARDPLYTCLALAGCDPALRELWGSCPVALTGDALAALHDGLTDGQPGVRLVACRLIAALDAVDSAPWVEELLQDADAEVRAVAIHTLAAFRHHVVVPGIVRRLHDPARAVRDAAVLALSRMDAELVSIALLCETLGTGALHRPALAIMRVNPHPAQQRFIEACLGDRRPRVRAAAIRALERLTEADLPTRLQPLLDDPQALVRTAATTALGRSRDPRARDLLVLHLRREASHGAGPGPVEEDPAAT